MQEAAVSPPSESSASQNEIEDDRDSTASSKLEVTVPFPFEFFESQDEIEHDREFTASSMQGTTVPPPLACSSDFQNISENHQNSTDCPIVEVTIPLLFESAESPEENEDGGDFPVSSMLKETILPPLESFESQNEIGTVSLMQETDVPAFLESSKSPNENRSQDFHAVTASSMQEATAPPSLLQNGNEDCRDFTVSLMQETIVSPPLVSSEFQNENEGENDQDSSICTSMERATRTALETSVQIAPVTADSKGSLIALYYDQL